MVFVPANAQIDCDAVMEQPEECWLQIKRTDPPHINGMTYEERIKSIEDAVEVILWAIGEDATREGLKDTPKRVAKMWIGELSVGYSSPLNKVFGTAIFNEGHDEMVLVKDISFFSSCEHHLVPYFGKMHIAYIPKGGRICGISKLARLVEQASRRLTIQEKLTSEIADVIEECLTPEGIMVVAEAQHMCMGCRGVKKPEAKTTTSVVRGIFKWNQAARSEFLTLIR